MGVTLGPIAFRAMEIPEEIPFGGPHVTARHQLIGGDRVFDQMGDDPAPIEWTGWFIGPDAASRARTLDAMKARGGQYLLTWGSFARQVVIRSFDPRYGFEYRVAYKVCVEVVPTSAASEPTLDDVLSADFGTLSGIALDITSAGLIGGAQAALAVAASAAPTGLLADAPLYAMQAALSPVLDAANGLIATRDAADAAMPEVDLAAIPGAGPPDFALALLQFADTSGTLSDLATASAYMGRIAANVARAGG